MTKLAKNKKIKKINKKRSVKKTVKLKVRKKKPIITKSVKQKDIKLKETQDKTELDKITDAQQQDIIFDPFNPENRENNFYIDHKKVEEVENFLTQPNPKQVIKEEQGKSNNKKDKFINVKKVAKDASMPVRTSIIKYKVKKKLLDDENEKEVDDVFAPRVNFFGLVLPYGWQKALVAFFVILVFLILPLFSMLYIGKLVEVKNRVINLSFEAYQHLENAQGGIVAYNFNDATNEFESASKKFEQAKKEVNDINFLTLALVNILPQTRNPFSSGMNLLSAGQNISDAGFYLSEGINSFWQKNTSLEQKFSFFNHDLSLALLNIARAQDNISQVNLESSDVGESESIKKAYDQLPLAQNKLQEFSVVSNAMLKFLGQDMWQRYLVIFQNNNEIRATGGFLGSYALLDIDQGKIKNLDVPAQGSYYIQGSLNTSINAPKPLQIINPRWQFHDSNWWPDFPTTAKKVKWFYENSDGPTVDGVIALTSSFMEDLLEVTGPIEMPEYGRIITADNFELETQKIVELEFDRETNKPKQFLSDLSPKMIEKLTHLNQKESLKLIEIIYRNLMQKNIMFYFEDTQLQEIALAFNWAGQMQETDFDYLSVISSNIGGAKTDQVITTKLNHEVEIASDGTIIDTLIVTKQHNGDEESVFTGRQNFDYLRVYVPEGSELLVAEGFSPMEQNSYKIDTNLTTDLDIALHETNKTTDIATQTQIYNESKKTVFANWFIISPGEEKSITLKYKLPYQFEDKYSLLIQKQAGKDDISFTNNIKFKNKVEITDAFPKNEFGEVNNVLNSDILNKDLFFGLTTTN